MDATRFDRLTRRLIGSPSRRAFGRIALGALAALLTGTEADGALAPCPTGKKRCHGRCIPKRRCCTTANCPRNSGKVCRNGRCICPSGRELCGSRCIPTDDCCPIKTCPNPDHRCIDGTCRCPNGQKPCDGSCILSTECCDCASGVDEACVTATTCDVGTCLYEFEPQGTSCPGGTCNESGNCRTCEGAGESCNTTNVGVCQAGFKQCNDDGQPVCVSSIAPGSQPEVPGNGLDDDCDGITA